MGVSETPLHRRDSVAAGPRPYFGLLLQPNHHDPRQVEKELAGDLRGMLLDPVDAKGLDGLYDRLGDLAQESGAQSVNLMQAFQGYDMESVKLPDDAWHPNETGHRIIAERLFSYFMDNNILMGTFNN